MKEFWTDLIIQRFTKGSGKVWVEDLIKNPFKYPIEDSFVHPNPVESICNGSRTRGFHHNSILKAIKVQDKKTSYH